MSSHDCPKQECTCSEVQELTELYRNLKCQRKRAKEDDCEESECISEAELQMTRSQAEHVLAIVRTQRQGVRNLMTALRDFSQKLSKQEEMACQADKEIAELREQMCQIKEQRENKRQVSANEQCCDSEISAEEVAWRQALDLEIGEQCRLKNKIKQLTECLEDRKRQEYTADLERQEERRTDAKLLLNAMDFVERCIQE